MSDYGSDKVRRLVAMVEVVPGARDESIEAALELGDDVVDRMRQSARADGSSSELRLTHPQFVRDGRRYVLSVRAVRGGIPIICLVVADVCYALLRAGVCSRGAVVLGEATHTPGGVSGSAIGEALTLMRAQTLPRVAVSQAAELVVRQFWEPSSTDTDGTLFMNFFRGRMGAHHGEVSAKIRDELEAERDEPARWLLAQMRAAAAS